MTSKFQVKFKRRYAKGEVVPMPSPADPFQKAQKFLCETYPGPGLDWGIGYDTQELWYKHFKFRWVHAVHAPGSSNLIATHSIAEFDSEEDYLIFLLSM